MAVTADEGLGVRIIERCDELATLSEDAQGLTRTFGTAMHRRALERIGAWMVEAGMNIREDAAGNLIGRYEAVEPAAPCIMMGSHQDSVRNAGKYDGPLGILAPIEAVAALNAAGTRLSVAVEVIAFTDEEGTRFQTALLGSRAVAGTLGRETLAVRDRDGITVAEAMREFGLDPDRIDEARRDPDELMAFVETHIEQGVRLQDADQPIGIVIAIAGSTRLVIRLQGQAGHAGTVPMNLRRDALCAAADMILVAEELATQRNGMVITTGQISAAPGAINVIPGEAEFTIDLRAPEDADRKRGVRDLSNRFADIADRRSVTIDIETLHDAPACKSDPRIVELLTTSVSAHGIEPMQLVSGAGHDAMAMAAVAPMGMLFVRCRDGISHNPAEEITADDAGVAVGVLLTFLSNHA